MQTIILLVRQYSYSMVILFARRAIFPRQRMRDVSDDRTECSEEQLSLSPVENGVRRKLTTIVQYVKIR